MTRLAWTFLRSGGWMRVVLLAGTTAVATALVLVALTMILLPIQPAALERCIRARFQRKGQAVVDLNLAAFKSGQEVEACTARR